MLEKLKLELTPVADNSVAIVKSAGNDLSAAALGIGPPLQNDAQEGTPSAIAPKIVMPGGKEKEKTAPGSVVDSLFCGKTATSFVCTNCHCRKTKEENFYLLSLPIPDTVLPIPRVRIRRNS